MLDLKALRECAELAQQLDCECEECKTPRNECARAVPELIGEIERLREALKSIMTYYEIEYRQGEKAYQAAIIARRALGEK